MTLDSELWVDYELWVDSELRTLDFEPQSCKCHNATSAADNLEARLSCVQALRIAEAEQVQHVGERRNPLPQIRLALKLDQRSYTGTHRVIRGNSQELTGTHGLTITLAHAHAHSTLTLSLSR